jgi:ribosomal protein L27
MPSNDSVKKALALIEGADSKSKVLGLKVGNHLVVEPGQYIPRAGETPTAPLTKPAPR